MYQIPQGNDLANALPKYEAMEAYTYNHALIQVISNNAKLPPDSNQLFLPLDIGSDD